MRKTVFLVFVPLFLTCAQFPILSDLTNDRIQVILKGTYESNDPYGWNTNLYSDDALPSLISSPVAFSDVDMYLDIAEIRLATGTGITDSDVPADYWTYFTRKREVFCSSELTPTNHDLVSCRNNNGADNYNELFTTGYTYPASDIPEDEYHHAAIYFRKFVTAPTYQYDASYSDTSKTSLTTIFDNRVVDGTDLMESLLQYESSDTDQTTPLLTPLERTDLNLVIPGGTEPFVVEIRLFIKNLLMKHAIEYGNYQNNLDATHSPVTFVSLSDWKTNHTVSGPSLESFNMGGQLVFTARVYDPANVGTIVVTGDSEGLPAYKSYYAVLPAGETFLDTNGNDVLPYAATSRVYNGVSPYDKISNLPPGNYDIYKTCDTSIRTTAGLVAGEDGYPETKVICSSNVTVAADSETNVNLTCTCP